MRGVPCLLLGICLAVVCCLAISVGSGCSNSTEPEANTGGPAVLVGSFDVQTVMPGVVTVSVYRPTDYSRALGSTTIASARDSFRIADLPADTVDIITTSPCYFASKECNVVLEEGENAFEKITVTRRS